MDCLGEEPAMDDERQTQDRPDDGTLVRLRNELRFVEEEIDRARQEAAECRQRIGDRVEGATDMEDQSSAITQAEDQEELLGILTTRRDTVQERIRALRHDSMTAAD